MNQPLRDAIRRAMGDIRLVREGVLIPTAAWDAAVVNMLRVHEGIPPAEDAADAEPTIAERAPFSLELGQIASARRVARLCLGMPPEEARAGASSGGGVASVTEEGAMGQRAAAAGNTSGAAQARKLRLLQVFDQVDDTEIVPWTPARTRAVLVACKAANDGEDPEPEE